MQRSTSNLRDRLADWYGRLEYRVRPSLSRRRGGPFNGQVLRQSCYGELQKKFGFSAIIETGSYRGITTSLFARAGVPVYSIETNPRFAAYSETRLRHEPHVRILRGDSRWQLSRLAKDALVPKRNVFFYLDAHWFDDLPLREEIEIVMQGWEDWVIMVDDFQVPGTTYAYDAYGPGKNLEADYLQPLLDRGLCMFYPSLPASAETGARRGCVVLCGQETVRRRLTTCHHLRPASTSLLSQAA